jgi:hypothetical protein
MMDCAQPTVSEFANSIGRQSQEVSMNFALLTLVLLSPASGLTVDEFKTLHAQLQPAKGEAWRTIPWKASLVEAQSLAARTKKPLFIWAMDGHPLGCT